MNVKDKGLKKERTLSVKEKKRLKGSPIFFLIIAVIILIIVSKNYFSFLELQFFEERKSHIVEFTDKASEIVDGVIEHSWQQLLACEYVIKMRDMISQEELFNTFSSMSDFIDEENTLVLAIDSNVNYYSSDHCKGRWSQTDMLTRKANNSQQIVAEIPHKAQHFYFIFMKRLENAVFIDNKDNTITHLAIGIDMEAIRDKISVKGFDDQCYTYLVNKDGRRLYKYTYADNFIEGYNVLNAFKGYTIIHGGTYQNFIERLEQGEYTALEFEFIDDNGKKQEWFVANAAISSENWQVLLFVPTKVLGANTTLLMNRTIRFFVIVSIILFAMLTVLVIMMMISKANKQLMEQKDKANLLLKTAAEEADNANKAKSDFLSHMSHDIRTPINGIMGMTDIALKNIGNQDKILDCLHKISGSSQHLLSLINDVLDMSRIESGKTKMNHDNFDIRTCIDNCVSIISGQLATRNIELIKEFDMFLHPLLIGDELHLRQVFINILGNSVKFTPDGGKIYFRAKEKQSQEDRALFRFELEDTGIGMKAEFLPHLFEAFAQEDNGTRTTYKGTGLGMAITKEFVDLMGGTIEVKSELNLGTKFVIELWMDIDKDTKVTDLETDIQINLNGMNILLVEDIELNLEIAQSILEEEGVNVTPVMNGQEAVDAIVNNPIGTFDAVLMDIMMPVMDGITATKTIRALEREDAKTIPIIAMTANAYEEDVRKTHEAGMNAHLSKPIDVNMMIKTLAGFYHIKEKSKEVDFTGFKVLIADDVELNLEIARAILEEQGMIVTTVENGEEAVNAFSENPENTFYAILMDMNMPVMDGITATKTIRAMDREDAKEIPILAMTADVYEEDIEKAKNAGMDGHLAKPLEIEKIMQTLSKYCKIS